MSGNYPRNIFEFRKELFNKNIKILIDMNRYHQYTKNIALQNSIRYIQDS